MKKLLALLMAMAMFLTFLTACGAADPTPSEDADAAGAESAEPQDTSSDEEVVYTFEGPGIFDDVADVPDSYKEPAAQQGTVEQVSYTYGEEEKYFLIYLPYGYESGTENYNVLYVSHGGGGGKPETFLKVDEKTALQNTVDNMIQNGEIAPFILVAPTWKSTTFTADAGYDASTAMIENFVKNELRQYVVATVDANYRTNASREGRAFSGFSAGGVTTWFTFIHDMDTFKYFVPMSGDCWAVEQTGGATKPVETAEVLAKAVTDQGYTGADFKVYAFTGGGDYALPNLAPQIYAMQDNPMFIFGENTFFGLHPTATHGDPMARIYLFYVLPLLWGE